MFHLSRINSLKATYGFTELLTTNAKLSKGCHTYRVKGLTLAPHKSSGRNVCPSAGHCARACVLWYSGRTRMKSVRAAMIARTKMFFNDRLAFWELLDYAITSHQLRCEDDNAIPVVRLNVASDLRFEKLQPTIFDRDVQFYDYTKITRRALDYAAGKLPSNYHLTYSMSERSDENTVRQLLENGVNVACVVDAAYCPQHQICQTLPKTLRIAGKRFTTVDGDDHDVRLPGIDGKGKVILLRAKGSIKNVLESVDAGFVRKVRNGRSSSHELVSV